MGDPTAYAFGMFPGCFIGPAVLIDPAACDVEFSAQPDFLSITFIPKGADRDKAYPELQIDDDEFRDLLSECRDSTESARIELIAIANAAGRPDLADLLKRGRG